MFRVDTVPGLFVPASPLTSTEGTFWLTEWPDPTSGKQAGPPEVLKVEFWWDAPL
jgi:hypothetical protein